MLLKLRSGEVVHQIETFHVRKDGSQVAVSVTISPTRDAQGAVHAISTIARDMTARRVAQEALARSEQRYRVLFESNPQPMWVYDQETLAFLTVNDTAVRRYGYTREEFAR